MAGGPMKFDQWIAIASVIVVALGAYFPLRYAIRKDEREQENASAEATRQAVADARSEWDKDKTELIGERDYWRKLAADLQAQINDLLSGRHHRHD